jgi:hypothetical protein
MHEFFVSLWNAIINEILGPRQRRVEILSEQDVFVSIKEGDFRSVWTVIKVESWRHWFFPLSHRTQYFSRLRLKEGTSQPLTVQGREHEFDGDWLEIATPDGGGDDAIAQAVALALGMQGYRAPNGEWRPLPVRRVPSSTAPCKEGGQ